ncbi:MAG TPA: hypothetical protein VGN69_10735, partial [Solirubrobacteraceae bacterium]|nr:hypothetical protein [Solirubrobacteraceae bacterium]
MIEDPPADDVATPDPRERPSDPAGTRPKVDPASLLPARRSIDLGPPVDGQAEEEALLPELRTEGGAVGPPVEAPHAARFQFLLGALLALAAVGVAAAVVLIAGRSPKAPEASWSAWHPSSSG